MGGGGGVKGGKGQNEGGSGTLSYSYALSLGASPGGVVGCRMECGHPRR